MGAHLLSCATCAVYDARIRRALFLVRNIPRIQASADFEKRLERRIQQERAEKTFRSLRAPTPRRLMALAAASVLAAGLTVQWLERSWSAKSPPRLPPVLAFRPAVLDSVTAPAIVAAMSAGMVAWPVLWLAEEASFRFASVGPDQASLPARRP